MMTRNLRIIVGILFVIFLIAMYFFVTNYFNHIERIDIVNAQIDELEQKIDEIDVKMNSLPSDQDNRLVELESELDATSNRIPDTIVVNAVIEKLLKLADIHGVSILPLVNQDWAVVTIGERDYRQLKLTVSISGSWQSLKSYLEDVQNTEYETLACESISSSIEGLQYGEDITTSQLIITVFTKNINS